MNRSIDISKSSKINSSIDIVKIALAVMVIADHTKLFASNYWIDKGIAIFVRLIIPFFLMTSAYFFWQKEKSPVIFLRRILTLYVVWSLIYMPFDMERLSQMSVGEILRYYLWDRNAHPLWYLCATTVGFIITYALLKFFKPKQVLAIGIVVLTIGTFKTSYSTAVYQLFGIRLPNYIGARNGFFYAFPYMALGMTIAKSDNQGIFKYGIRKFYIGFFVSMLLVAAEGLLFVRYFKAEVRLLWLSVLPFSYCFFEIVLNSKIELDRSMSLLLRKMSTLMYVSHYLFVIILRDTVTFVPLFFPTVCFTILFSLIIIKLSNYKSFAFLRYLY